MRVSILTLGAGLLLMGGVGADRADAQQPPANPGAAPAALNLSEHTATLGGQWLLKLPAGAQYTTVLRAAGDKGFRLEKAVRFSGDYEIRDNKLVLVKSHDPKEVGWAWELRQPDELVLVGQPPKFSQSYLGATLKQQTVGAPEEVAPLKPKPVEAPRPVAPPQPRPVDAPPALNLAEHTTRLAGQWLLRLPAGAQYATVLRAAGNNRFGLEKAVRFSGDYEIRDNKFVLVRGRDPREAGWAWELRQPGELVLVGEPPDAGNSYLGAILKQQTVDAPADATPAVAPAGKATALATGEPAAPAARLPFYLTIVGGFLVLVLGAALGLWLGRMQRSPGNSSATGAAPKGAVVCRSCGKSLKVRDSHAGKKVKCPQCGKAVLVPKPADDEAE
jgi:hypothetical protein